MKAKELAEAILALPPEQQELEVTYFDGDWLDPCEAPTRVILDKHGIPCATLHPDGQEVISISS